jgi:Tol biopolymer transport system component
MSLSPRERLGPYEILERIGAGGMGEVYRARDTRLGRDVAVKVSAQRFSERFEREARAIASLNHPNICTLHDVGPDYLVMELVEGPTLADRIKEGAIPLDETLAIGRQIADALDAAHEKGIVHRDLKPGNVKIKPDGVVKVLDFGLAKTGGTPAVPDDKSPTLTMGETEAGMILGTAAYMSPEQAKGKPVDKRADIYAFGVVLYEMVTGKRLHGGESTTEVLASVIKEEPKWERIPAQMQRLLRRCLEKDPQKRLRHIGDVMALVDDVPPAGGGLQEVAKLQPGSRRWLWPAVSGTMAAVALVVYFLAVRPGAPPRAASRFQVLLPEKGTLVPSGAFSISPDGRKLIFAVATTDGTRQLWIRSLDSLEAHPLPGAEVMNPSPPGWSPDSKYAVYNTGGKLYKVDTAGGPPLALCDINGAIGFSWNRDGVILYGTSRGIMRVSASGGAPSPATALDPARQETGHLHPIFLPDGKHFIYLRSSAVEAASSGIYLGSLETDPARQDTKRLLASDLNAGYASSTSGNEGKLLFVRQNTLMAQTFDSRKFELTGDPVPVAQQIGVSNPLRWAFFSASQNGVLVHRGGLAGQNLQLTWFDRQGKLIGTAGEAGPYNTAFLSPDGKQAVLGQVDTQSGNDDLWIMDLVKGTNTRLTFDPATDTQPAWSPDSRNIAFYSNRASAPGIYVKASNGVGNEELLLKSSATQGIHWSEDGKYLVYAITDTKTGLDLWVLPLNADQKGERKPIPFLRTDFNERIAHFSPDSKWIAYLSNESGRFELYVQPFHPAAGDSIPGTANQITGKWMVSKGGSAGMIRWRHDMKEMYYLSPDGQVMALDIDTTHGFQAGSPAPLFKLPPVFLRASGNPGALADVSPDGKRFLLAMPVSQGSREEFTVVLNWDAALN